jgi:hypothetical protein
LGIITPKGTCGQSIFRAITPKIRKVGELAKLSALIATLSDVLGMPESAVESYVKPLRKAGLIVSGPRGTAAPDIPPGQMAFIVIAILNGSPTHAVERAIYYGSLISNPNPLEDELAFITNFDLSPGHTFLEMLTNVIHFFADHSFTKRTIKAAQESTIYDSTLKTSLLQIGVNRDVDLSTSEDVYVEMHEPVPGADITFSVWIFKIATATRRDDIKVHYSPPGLFHKKGPAFPGAVRSDLERTCRISGTRTLRRLGLLTRDD